MKSRSGRKLRPQDVLLRSAAALLLTVPYRPVRADESEVARVPVADLPPLPQISDEGARVSDVTSYAAQAYDTFNIKITTASRFEEPIRDAPVPVTVITDEMIRDSGARSIAELLATFVPGMTAVADHNEVNVAMRGIYASSQQKILVMINGHRINSRAYSMGALDHSVDIDPAKIQQIEVLRGPGSSLYGNVALTAVVNIVTKQPADLKGATVSFHAGDYLSRGDGNLLRSHGNLAAAGRQARFTYGQSFGSTHDLLLWGSMYKADGQELAIGANEDIVGGPMDTPQDGVAILDGEKDPFSYDIGGRYRVGNFSLLGAARRGKLVEPFSSGGQTGETYNYDDYRPFDGTAPGLLSESSHLELKYVKPFSVAPLSVEATAYHDTNDLTVVLVADPSRRAYSYVGWTDRAIGAVAQARYDYLTAPYGSSNISLGMQIDRMELLDSNNLVGLDGTWTMANDAMKRVLDTGSEIIYSGFAQLKHRFSEKLLANLGARIDYKLRRPDNFEGDEVSDFSPRLGLVYLPSPDLNFKLSYAESFVDAPYWYRYNSFPTYQGSNALTPEHLRSLQFTPRFATLGGRLQSSLNFFYNHVFDFIFRDTDPMATQKYLNAGELKSAGAELELAFLERTLRAQGNLTYQRVLSTDRYTAEADEPIDGEDACRCIYSVPSLHGNVLVDVNPLSRFTSKTWLHLAARYVGAQHSPIKGFRLDAATGMLASATDLDHEQSAYMLFNLGVRVSGLYYPGLNLDATMFNLLDTRYRQGGSVQFPYPQPGRAVFLSATYHFGERAR
jgi:iron complex outermembrane receptor protein